MGRTLPAQGRRHCLGDFLPIHGGGNVAAVDLPDSQLVVGAYRSVFGDQRNFRRRRFRGDQAVEDIPRPVHPRRRANDPLKADVGQPQADLGREVPDDFGRLDAEAADLVEELQFEFDHPRDNQIVILDGLGRGLAQTISERVIKPDDDMRIEIG